MHTIGAVLDRIWIIRPLFCILHYCLMLFMWNLLQNPPSPLLTSSTTQAFIVAGISVLLKKLHSNEDSRKPGCATAMWLKTIFCRFQAKHDRCGCNGVVSSTELTALCVLTTMVSGKGTTTWFHGCPLASAFAMKKECANLISCRNYLHFSPHFYRHHSIRWRQSRMSPLVPSYNEQWSLKLKNEQVRVLLIDYWAGSSLWSASE